MKLLPSLLYSDFEQFSARFNQCVELGYETHIDFADGEFVPNRLPSIDRVKTLPGKIVLEAHFMVQQPATWVESALEDDRFQTIIIHAEAEVEIAEIVAQVKQSGRKIGLALKPSTTIEQVATNLDRVDQVLVLLVDPGFNGSPFMPEVLDKIRELHQRYPHLIIEADGGMNPDTLPLAQSAGANRAAIGSFLHDRNLATSLADIQKQLEKGDG